MATPNLTERVLQNRTFVKITGHQKNEKRPKSWLNYWLQRASTPTLVPRKLEGNLPQKKMLQKPFSQPPPICGERMTTDGAMQCGSKVRMTNVSFSASASPTVSSHSGLTGVEKTAVQSNFDPEGWGWVMTTSSLPVVDLIRWWFHSCKSQEKVKKALILWQKKKMQLIGHPESLFRYLKTNYLEPMVNT